MNTVAAKPTRRVFVWRGVQFTLGGDGITWMSAEKRWKVVRYQPAGEWYARLRIGVHRFHGEASSRTAALINAESAARETSELLTTALQALQA